VGSPYNEVYKHFGDDYERRLAKRDRFPGYMEDVKQYHPAGANHNPGFFLFFDPEGLTHRVSEAGFRVLRATYMDVAKNRRAHTGLVASKR
jgi:hypothetical protein